MEDECPCREFRSIESICSVLNSKERVQNLLDWISCRNNNNLSENNSKCGIWCSRRVHASLAILNAIRETCRIYLEVTDERKDSLQKKKVDIQTKNSYEDEFPSLGKKINNNKNGDFPSLKTANTFATRKNYSNNNNNKASAAVGKTKRRIRPAVVDKTSWGQGNLVNLPESSKDDPFPSLDSKRTPSNTTTITPKKASKLKTKILEPLVSTPQSQPVQKDIVVVETFEEVTQDTALQSLIDLYCSLIDNSLVPSSILELHLLIRLLTISNEKKLSDVVDNKMNELPLNKILSSGDRCIYFATESLRKLSWLLQGLGVVILKDLVCCPPFQKYLPDLVEEFSKQLQEDTTTFENIIVFPIENTALLTLPFNEERDSRHNYRTREEQAIYKNREESRDAFMYQIRSFLNLRGSLIDGSKAVQKIRQSASNIINGLIDHNLGWFTEFFIEMLLQIGNVPIQETDQELLKITDKEKLQKLHRRFSSKSARTDRSNKTLAADPKYDSASPTTAAQQYFHGHQEFFFLFITSADSYAFSVHLRALLIVKIRSISTETIISASIEKQILDLRLLARFLGLVIFSPNWRSSREGKLWFPSEESLNVLQQLSASRLCLLDILDGSYGSGGLVLNILWIAELLKMSKWDTRTLTSSNYFNLCSKLRQIQLEHVGRTGSDSIVILLSLENLFGEFVGLSQTSKFKPIKLGEKQDENGTVEKSNEIAHAPNNPAFYLASNTHVEELVALMTELAKKKSLPVRSPGVSKKLRPSVVSPLVTSLESPSPINNSELDFGVDNQANATSMFDQTSGVNNIQSKLRDTFFHQHGDLKNICQLVVGQTLKNIGAEVIGKFIRPTLISEDFDEKEDLNELQRMVLKSCFTFVEAFLRDKVTAAIDILAPSDIDASVKSIAISMAVEHGCLVSKPTIQNLVLQEFSKAKVAKERKERKQLFGKESADSDDSQKPPYSKHTATAVSLISRLTAELASFPASHMSVLQSITELNTALDELVSIVDPTVPPEPELRPFFEAILALDECSNFIVQWAFAEEPDSLYTDRFALVEAYGQTALKLIKWSKFGLRQMLSFMSDELFLENSIMLACEIDDAYRLSSLFSLLVETRIVKRSSIRNVINRSKDLEKRADLSKLLDQIVP